MKNTIINIITFLFAMTVCSVAQSKDYSTWIEHCEPYRNTVERILDNESVSKEFYYLMVAESRCRINAESEKGALGFWQLMPATSRQYGCNNPNDLECATTAAAKYLKHLSTRFSTFEEVIYAYNMGGHNYAKFGKTSEAKSLFYRVSIIKKQDNQ